MFSYDDENIAEASKVKIQPSDLFDKVSKDVIGQDEPVRAFINAFAYQLERANRIAKGANPSLLPNKKSILIAGTTATGKTYATKKVVEAAGLPMFSVSCAELTGAGWKGRDLNSFLSTISTFQEKHKGKVCVAFFDEFDKIVKGSGNQGFAPQSDFLTLLDGGVIEFENPAKNGSQVALNTDLVICVLAGAFTGVEKIESTDEPEVYESKLVFKPAGFVKGEIRETVDEPVRGEITIDALNRWGIMYEICGRIGNIISFPTLGEHELERIVELNEPRYQQMWPSGASLEIEPEVRKLAALHALESETGARGALSFIERHINDAWAQCSDNNDITHVCLKACNGEIVASTESGRRVVVYEPDEEAARAFASGKAIAAEYDEIFEAVPHICRGDYIGRASLNKLCELVSTKDFKELVKPARVNNYEVADALLRLDELNWKNYFKPDRDVIVLSQKFLSAALCYIALKNSDENEIASSREEDLLNLEGVFEVLADFFTEDFTESGPVCVWEERFCSDDGDAALDINFACSTQTKERKQLFELALLNFKKFEHMRWHVMKRKAVRFTIYRMLEIGLYEDKFEKVKGSIEEMLRTPAEELEFVDTLSGGATNFELPEDDCPFQDGL